MAGEIRHLDSYDADWQKRRSKIPKGSPLLNLSTSGWESFKRLGFPTDRRGSELWKYTDVRAINAEAFRWGLPSARPELESINEIVPLPPHWINFVYVDGEPVANGPQLPSRGGMESSTDWTTRIGIIAEHDQSAFVALNSAFCSRAQAVVVDEAGLPPVHVVWISTGGGSASRVNYPRMVYQSRPGQSATLIETHVSLTDEALLEVPVVEIDLEPDAELSHYRFQISKSSTYHIATTRVRQAARSSYRAISFAAGAAIGRQDMHAHLDEGAECVLHGLYVTNGTQHQSNEISTTHAKPNGTSHQYYKGILSGTSQAVFSGKVVVERNAQKTDAEQKDLNLLLSHGAEIDTKPSLEIYADDVQCSHGATAGHVDEDTLFYLHSRGIDYQTAQAMLIRGFAQEIVDEFDLPELRIFASRQMDELMPALQASSDTIGTA